MSDIILYISKKVKRRNCGALLAFSDQKLEFLDLEIVQFNRCVAAKHADQNFDFSFDWINGVNSSVKAFKWTVGDVDDFADLQVNFMLGFFRAHPFLESGAALDACAKPTAG